MRGRMEGGERRERKGGEKRGRREEGRRGVREERGRGGGRERKGEGGSDPEHRPFVKEAKRRGQKATSQGKYSAGSRRTPTAARITTTTV